MMTVGELAAEIANIPGVAPNPGASLEDVRATELRLGVPIPAELRELVAVMNGCDGETPPDQSWTRFWPLRDWRKVGNSGSGAEFTKAIVFADYCGESWWYAFEATGTDTAKVAKINGPDCIVADCLREFLSGVLRDDPKIYGPTAG